MPTILLACLLFAASLGALAQEPEAAVRGGDGIVDMEAMVVSGAQPGPGMWKVSRDGRVLWILGTVTPLPRRMEWASSEVEATIAQSQQVLDAPSATVDSGAGVFRNMLLLPSLLRMRRNPDGRTLQDSVPAEAYARWLPLKARYIGRSRGVERWRPIFAAQELYEAAIKRSGMTLDSVAEPVVARAAKRHRVPRTPVEMRIVVEDPKSAIREFNSGPLSDTECFTRTLSHIETDLDAMRERANAWAVGDTEALHNARFDDQYAACIRAVTETGLARRLGLDNVSRRLGDAWLEAAESALAVNASTFASLPLPALLREDGVLARLQAKGYAVEAP
ncbi:TraB/GumN family protein [Luteimonas suaedae]|uniref:TraB/GumN family protein n=1 Tax=Luteimonas suaedae TaxID=2605430 RepID=UPI00165926F5|nr:TraB/GumN family protein [Luteimonas suaedae]